MTRVTPKLYFHWLIKQIRLPDNNGRWELFATLHEKQFTWSVPNDDNRVADAVELRREFWGDQVVEAEAANPVVSVLEVLIALSRRLSFEDDGPEDIWAWVLLENLSLHRNRFLDPLYTPERDEVDEILDRLIWRQYEANGQGGFFPLSNPTQDQTQVEVWYQMSAYLEEK